MHSHSRNNPSTLNACEIVGGTKSVYSRCGHLSQLCHVAFLFYEGEIVELAFKLGFQSGATDIHPDSQCFTLQAVSLGAWQMLPICLFSALVLSTLSLVAARFDSAQFTEGFHAIGLQRYLFSRFQEVLRRVWSVETRHREGGSSCKITGQEQPVARR